MNLLTTLLFPLYTFFTHAYPQCYNCKWFSGNPSNILLGKCNYIKYKLIYGQKEINLSNSIVNCRLNPYMCGIYGKYFEPTNTTLSTVDTSNEINKLTTELLELENNFNGEIYENNEIKKWEEEINIIKQKIKQLKNDILQ